jgi:hypothetical protein
MNIDLIETQRQSLQSKLDGEKTQEERNIMGNFQHPLPLLLMS